MKERLKLIRKHFNLTQKELAKKLETTRSRVASWEAGVEPLSALRQYQICKELGIRRDWLETGAGEMLVPSEDIRAVQRRIVLHVFETLTEQQQAIILDALGDKFNSRQLNLGVTKTQINNGSVGGDMNQN